MCCSALSKKEPPGLFELEDQRSTHTETLIGHPPIPCTPQLPCLHPTKSISPPSLEHRCPLPPSNKTNSPLINKYTTLPPLPLSMVQVHPPLNPLPHKVRPSAYRCSPLTSRHTISSQELSFSLAKRNNALERVAIRNLTSQFPALSHRLSLSNIHSTTVTPVLTGLSVPAEPSTQPTPSTPLTPLEVDQTALHSIYIEDFSQDSGILYPTPATQADVEAIMPEVGAYRDCSSPDLTDASSVSSTSSTPYSVYTPPPMSLETEPEIVYPSRGGTPKYHIASCSAHAIKAKLQSIGRTQSLPSNYQYQTQATAPRPILEDKSLRWFLTELLRRSRASASVVQLALYYLKQARQPIGEILNRKFKSIRVSGEDGVGPDTDSPLVDPRKLVLAAIMLSTKILHDHAPNSRAWSRVCGLEARQVSACESALGQALNWELMHTIVGPRDDSVLFE
ncbi:Cyclin domain-containing protein [Rhizoctonia solani AG-1 IA]|uniref:Cyclin domain-containing protein n=1 Tax=Thanatephorus cucumeris (strain AG1-IA) TaxID=983506 RepID=L8WMM5_THACA|nr:Cyclin domain-containing protein [Rhizoctonia solani AG-1 IA]